MKTLNKKGQAGLEILLSVVVTLFVIGLLVFIFTYMGSQIESEVYSTTSEKANTTATGVLTLSNSIAPSGSYTAYNITNGSSAVLISSTHYTASGNTVTFTSGHYNSSGILSEYEYLGTTAISVNETKTALSNTSQWFGIIIVITAMVVLILLTTLIIRAIRGGGLGDVGRGSGESGESGSA